MIIHVVEPGESVYTIARRYGVSSASIISDNELSSPDRLVPGETLVVMTGDIRHTVARGDTIYRLAQKYNVSVNDILDANPQLGGSSRIYPGDVLVIPVGGQKLGTIYVNGYAFPNISADVLDKTLPSLTYLSIFSYQVRADGSLKGINDTPLIEKARQAGVAPMMVITNIEEEGGFDSDLAHTVLTDMNVQNALFENVINTLQTKNYFGLDIDFEYIYPQDREAYNNFVARAVNEIGALGYTITTALAPKISGTQQGLLYEAHDYPVHGRLVDHVILMTYEWGYTFSPPMAVAPIREVRRVLDYAVSVIPREKILMGMPNYGYDWTLPYRPGTAARTVTNTGAVENAYNQGAVIRYDDASQAPFYNYTDGERRRHEVWFEDARSVSARLRLVGEYGLGGVSYWTINRYFPQNWLVLNSMYNVKKLL